MSIKEAVDSHMLNHENHLEYLKSRRIIMSRPIIMGAESVRAILEGRKTQTRRVIDPRKYNIAGWDMPRTKEDMKAGYPFAENADGDFVSVVDWCPYGRVGDRLWVKETWGVVSHTFDENENICDWKPNRPAKPIRELKFGTGYYDGHVIYKVDGGFEWNAGDDCSIETKIAWKSPIFMPRIASRITLEITDIRVERLQDITEEDAKAEEIKVLPLQDESDPSAWYQYTPGIFQARSATKSYELLWNSLNAKRGYSWEKNPWVWAITFKVASHD